MLHLLHLAGRQPHRLISRVLAPPVSPSGDLHALRRIQCRVTALSCASNSSSEQATRRRPSRPPRTGITPIHTGPLPDGVLAVEVNDERADPAPAAAPATRPSGSARRADALVRRRRLVTRVPAASVSHGRALPGDRLNAMYVAAADIAAVWDACPERTRASCRRWSCCTRPDRRRLDVSLAVAVRDAGAGAGTRSSRGS